MSCRIGVCTTTTAWLMTDGAATRPTDGVLGRVESKQACITSHCVAALMGWPPTGWAFVERARATCTDFDDLTHAAPHLWRRALTDNPLPADRSASVLLAGWSTERQQAELYELDSRYPPNGAELVVHLSGASANDDPTTTAFQQRFGEDPDAFRPHDGLVFLEAMRQQVRRFEDGRSQHYVGGFAQVTKITQDSARSWIMRRWPDRVGQHILPEKEAA